MKIAINGRGLIKKYTGISVVTKNLTIEMAKAYPDVQFLLVLSDKIKDDYSKVFPENVKIFILKEYFEKPNGLSKLFFEQVSFVNFCKKEKVDIAFYPYPSNPWIKGKIFTSVIAHDAIPWKMPYSNGILSSLYNWMSKKALNNADIVFCVSKFSKKDVMKYANIKEEKIKVVYNDAGASYKRESDTSEAKKLLKKIGVEKEKYFIYAGGYDERKNVKVLVKSFLEFAKTENNISLVLVGEKIFSTSHYSSFDEAKGHENIIFSGNLSDKELFEAYHNSLGLIHFSKEEGFNLPILEAANASTPLVLSDIEVNREIAGVSALYVDLNNPMESVSIMQKLLNSDFRAEMRLKSKNLAGQYLWERSALRYMDILLNNKKDVG